jgi:hypothetical protein
MTREPIPPPVTSAPPGQDPHLAYARQQRDWYAQHAPLARIGYQLLEIVVIALGASVPVAVALDADVGVTAVLGAGVVLAAGVRSVFRWQENWIGFIDAQIQLDDEIALYEFGDAPYDDAGRGERLARAVQAIKRQETDRWRARRSAGGRSAPDGAS